ncbi:IPT/TIG domain-containing protein [Streptomyces zingiberis]|uniref:IPT/TIG domain-containing protein n=1 Tax=Streptomyces zingiberis TaxID=2053010 RepID=A0ABX1BY36_9ACTN|nr:IPT/TIG domain-containing protein [Streptomyces zingiberis]NJQ00219.1 hypothetical protein [Streptomyces zingiberis]
MPTITSIAPTSGTTGTAVTITGPSGTFGTVGSTVRVNFGTRTVNGTVATATTVTTTAPAGCSGQTQVSVTALNSTSNSLPFFYITGPVVTSVSPALGTASPGSVTLTGTGLSTVTAASDVSFGGTPATAIVSRTGDTQLTVTAPTGTIGPSGIATVTVTATNPGGGSTPSPCGFSSFTYYAAPTVTPNSASPATAPAGTTGATATGANFYDLISVTLDPGDAPVQPTENAFATTSGLIVFDIPAGTPADAYSVVVQTPGGTSTPNPAFDDITVTA